MKIISIANQKGGCGKTTTAINLASAISLNGKRTLLIDMDPQAHATLGLNIDDKDSLYNVISKLTPRRLKLQDIIKKTQNRFDVIPSNILVGTLEQELADEIGRESKLTDILKSIQNNYDYVLIDCPPSLGFLTVNAIRASQQVIIPVETSRFSMQGVEHLTDIIHLIRDRLNHPVQSNVLITMFDSRLRHSFSMLATLKEKFNSTIFKTMIHVNVKLKESVVEGVPVDSYDKYSRGSKDYFTLAKEILTADGVFELKTTSRIAEATAAKTEKKIAEAPASSPRMQQLIKEETQNIQQVTFSLQAPEAKTVFVTGSFNDWALNEDFRMKQENGSWAVRVSLKPGLYKYQFIVDGKWQDDPSNPRKERNSFGDVNSFIEVAA